MRPARQDQSGAGIIAEGIIVLVEKHNFGTVLALNRQKALFRQTV